MLQLEFRLPLHVCRSTTVGQFLLLWDRWVDKEDRARHRAAVIAATVMNSAAGRRRRVIKPKDILPPLRDREAEQELNSPEDQVAALRMMLGDAYFEQEEIS